MAEYVMFLGKDGFDYYNAMLSGDKEKQKELHIKFAKQRQEEIAREYKWLQEHLSEEEYSVFTQIDKTHERKSYGNRNPLMYGDIYTFTWQIKDLFIEYKDYGKFNVDIFYNKGSYSLSIYYDGLDGYDQGYFNLKENISPTNIIEQIAIIKQDIKTGLKVE